MTTAACEWPSWLDLQYVDPEHLIGQVHVFRHAEHGTVYAIGPSSGMIDANHTSIGLSWYDDRGNWLGMDATTVATTNAFPTPSLQEYVRLLVKERLPAERVRWWRAVRLLRHCHPRPTQRCAPPRFASAQWLTKTFGRGTALVDVRIDRYYRQLSAKGEDKGKGNGNGKEYVYAIADKRMADAGTSWFDERGQRVNSSYVSGWDRPTVEQIQQQRKWDMSVVWNALCVEKDPTPTATLGRFVQQPLII